MNGIGDGQSDTAPVNGPPTVRLGAVQAESCWLDLQAGVDKVCAIIKDAGEKGVDILGFPVRRRLHRRATAC
jgi:hypothetical protein